MRLSELSLEGFRNYVGETVRFAPGVNVVTGKNAQGKTNLLEAAWLLTGSRPFRARTDAELIGFDAAFAAVSGVVDTSDRTETLQIKIPAGGRKSLYRGGVKLRSAAELRGALTCVLFCPDDLKTVREGSAAHRRLMDAALFQLRPRYAALISGYTRLYERKSKILRERREKPSLLDLLEEYNVQMAKLGAGIIRYRARYCEELSRRAAAIHGCFAAGSEQLCIEYKTVKTVSDPKNDAPELVYERLMEHQRAHARAELDSGLCLSGVHKDDLEISVNGRPARLFASQGQLRTAALSIKLAEREIHFADSGEYPVLLLDDVLSELDARRQEFVLNRITDGQVIITCCDGDVIRTRTNARVLLVDNGHIQTP